MLGANKPFETVSRDRIIPGRLPNPMPAGCRGCFLLSPCPRQRTAAQLHSYKKGSPTIYKAYNCWEGLPGGRQRTCSFFRLIVQISVLTACPICSHCYLLPLSSSSHKQILLGTRHCPGCFYRYLYIGYS